MLHPLSRRLQVASILVVAVFIGGGKSAYGSGSEFALTLGAEARAPNLRLNILDGPAQLEAAIGVDAVCPAIRLGLPQLAAGMVDGPELARLLSGSLSRLAAWNPFVSSGILPQRADSFRPEADLAAHALGAGIEPVPGIGAWMQSPPAPAGGPRPVRIGALVGRDPGSIGRAWLGAAVTRSLPASGPDPIPAPASDWWLDRNQLAAGALSQVQIVAAFASAPEAAESGWEAAVRLLAQANLPDALPGGFLAAGTTDFRLAPRPPAAAEIDAALDGPASDSEAAEPPVPLSRFGRLSGSLAGKLAQPGWGDAAEVRAAVEWRPLPGLSAAGRGCLTVESWPSAAELNRRTVLPVARPLSVDAAVRAEAGDRLAGIRAAWEMRSARDLADVWKQNHDFSARCALAPQIGAWRWRGAIEGRVGVDEGSFSSLTLRADTDLRWEHKGLALSAGMSGSLTAPAQWWEAGAGAASAAVALRLRAALTGRGNAEVLIRAADWNPAGGWPAFAQACSLVAAMGLEWL